MSDWISVKDGFPEDDVDVLIFVTCGDGILTGSFDSLIVSECNCGWAINCVWATMGSVTHWIPLPKPPE